MLICWKLSLARESEIDVNNFILVTGILSFIPPLMYLGRYPYADGLISPSPWLFWGRVWADVAGGIGTKLKVDYPTS